MRNFPPPERDGVAAGDRGPGRLPAALTERQRQLIEQERLTRDRAKVPIVLPPAAVASRIRTWYPRHAVTVEQVALYYQTR